MLIKLKKNFGLAQIPLLIGLLLMAVVIPAVTQLVQTSQENRSKASTFTCADTSGQYCAPATSCLAFGTGTCSVSTERCCKSMIVPTATRVPTAVPTTCACPASCANTYTGNTCGTDGCGKTCYGTKPIGPTATKTPTAVPTTSTYTCTNVAGQYCLQSGISCNSQGDVAGVGTCSGTNHCCKGVTPPTAAPTPACVGINMACVSTNQTCCTGYTPQIVSSNICISGRWCIKNTATPTPDSCTPIDSKACASGTSYKVCSWLHTWNSPVLCPSGQVCIGAGLCVVPTPTRVLTPTLPPCLKDGTVCYTIANFDLNPQCSSRCCNGFYGNRYGSFCGPAPTPTPACVGTNMACVSTNQTCCTGYTPQIVSSNICISGRWCIKNTSTPIPTVGVCTSGSQCALGLICSAGSLVGQTPGTCKSPYNGTCVNCCPTGKVVVNGVCVSPSATPTKVLTSTPTRPPTTPTVCLYGGCASEGASKCVATKNTEYFCDGYCWLVKKTCGNLGCYGDHCKVAPTPTGPTVVPTRPPATATRVPSATPTLVPTNPPTSLCTQCPTDFKCYTNGTEYKWFVTGYVMQGFTASTSTTCGGVIKPTYLGRSKGDANCDGKNDVVDFSLWHKEFFDGNKGAIVKKTWNADFTGTNGVCDGKVDVFDYSLWQKFFNELK